MTPEEATQLYNIEQHKYYEYCGYVVSYQNKIGEYQSEFPFANASKWRISKRKFKRIKSFLKL